MKTACLLSLAICLFFLVSCNSQEQKIITVTGAIPAGEIGKTLHHEHILVDFIGADSISFNRWDKDEVAEKVLPYLLEIKNLGYKTLVECTPEYLGRDPELLKILSEKSGLQILTNTGFYTAGEAKFIPKEAFGQTPQQIAEHWIDETKNGIEGTGIYPGFIKISVEMASLQEINRKIVEAACITHKATGLTIMSHTGTAVPAFQELEILEKYGVDPSAFIWTHANNEQDNNKILEAARKGAWIAFDNFKSENLDRFTEFALLMKKEGLLNKLMFSHDAGWYQPGEPGGGAFRGYTDIEDLLVPALRKNGFSGQEIDQLFTINPTEAFQIKTRLRN